MVVLLMRIKIAGCEPPHNCSPIPSSVIGIAVCGHVMRTKAIAFLLTSIAFSALCGKAIAHDPNPIAGEVRRAASESLQVYQKSGVSGLISAVSDCWKFPRDFCLYLDAASHRLALGATHSGTQLSEYFYDESVSKRGQAWLVSNGHGRVANEQYLQAIDQIMVRALVVQREKMPGGKP